MLTRWMQWIRPRRDAADADAADSSAPDTDKRPVLSNTPPRDHKPRRAALLPPTPPDRLFTPEGLERAWLAIKHAGGGAGVDGVTIAKFEANRATELDALRSALVGGTYRPQPVKQIMVPKTNGGLRPLALWALRDRVAQRLIYDLLAPVFEEEFLPCSYGFRPGRGATDAVAALESRRDAGLQWVVDGDIKDCFDSIPSARLLALLRRRVHDPLVLKYVTGWLEARILNSADGVPKRAGASQGNVLSPLLANVYLHEVDRTLIKAQLAYLRYADDFVVCTRSEADARAALATCRRSLRTWGLTISDRKTRIVHFDQGFAWLGYFFVRNERFVISP